MGVNTFQAEFKGWDSMAEINTKTISVRVPKDIAEWVNQNGGSAMVKAVIYAHIFTCTYGVYSGARMKLLQTLIEESAAATLESAGARGTIR